MRVKFFVGVFLFGFSVISNSEEVLENLVELDIKEDLPVCHHMADLINKDLNKLKKRGVKYKYRDIDYENHKEFLAIQWQERVMDIHHGITGKFLYKKPWKVAFFDLNNDGEKEWVTIEYWYKYGYEHFRLAVHDNSFENQTEINGLYYQNAWVLGRNNGSLQYRSEKIHSLFKVVQVRAFIYEEKTYLIFNRTETGNYFFIAEVNTDLTINKNGKKDSYLEDQGIKFFCLMNTVD